jgi:ArsR family transcriptional regulator
LDFFACFTSVAGPVCSTGRPQFGHEGAASETSLPQSGHLISATFKPPYRNMGTCTANHIKKRGPFDESNLLPTHFQRTTRGLDKLRYFYYSANMKVTDRDVLRYADMLAAMGAEPRLRIVRLLLEAHPEGRIAGDMGTELGIPASTLSHHLDKLKNEDLVCVRREGTFLWYTANTVALRDLMTFLFAECCGRNRPLKMDEFVQMKGK